LGAGSADNLTPDMRLAAHAVEHNAVFASFGRDGERFARLQFDKLKT
jgi:predicted nucleic acid-binding protein